MDAKKSTWVGGTVVLSVVLVALAWFVLITPLKTSTSQASSDADDAEARNSKLSSQLVVLKAQATHLEEYQAQLAALQTVLPTTAGLSDYLRSVNKLAEDRDVVLTAVTANTPVDVVVAADPAALVAPDPATTAEPAAGTDSAKDGDSTKDAESAADAPDAGVQPLAQVQIPGFVAIPFDITALGGARDVNRFVDDLQKGSPRPFLVTAMTGTGQADEDAAEGRPATHEGDLELTVSGYIYVLQDQAPVQPVTEPTAEPQAPAALPQWPTSGDPFTSGKG